MMFFPITTQASISVIIISVLVIIVGVLMIAANIGIVIFIKCKEASIYHRIDELHKNLKNLRFLVPMVRLLSQTKMKFLCCIASLCSSFVHCISRDTASSWYCSRCSDP